MHRWIRHWRHALAAVALNAATVLGLCSQTDQVNINAPFLGTSPAVVRAMLQMAQVSKNDVVYDLGCGDGRILIAAAKFHGAHGVGIDINPQRVQEARENAKREGVESLVRFEQGDALRSNIKPASVVMLYLLPDINLKLLPKLKAELKPGSRIVSHSFTMGDWKPQRTELVDGDRLFLWKIQSLALMAPKDVEH